MEYADESNITLTGTIFGFNSPTLLQVDDCQFSSPVPLADKLLFLPVCSSPSQTLGKILAKLPDAVNVTAMHSTWNGERGIIALKIGGDLSDPTEVFKPNLMTADSACILKF